MTKLFGIKNCDTVKKAKRWLENHNLDYHFIDVRQDGIDRKTLERWIDQIGWESLVNKRSTTWKSLDPEIRQNMDARNVTTTLLANPTLIKRPVLENDSEVWVGFNEADYQKRFNR